MDDTINYLNSHNVRLLKKGETVESVRNGTNVGATVGMLWLDIEGTQVGHTRTCGWPGRSQRH